jgi:hypothetical protein
MQQHVSATGSRSAYFGFAYRGSKRPTATVCDPSGIEFDRAIGSPYGIDRRTQKLPCVISPGANLSVQLAALKGLTAERNSGSPNENGTLHLARRSIYERSSASDRMSCDKLNPSSGRRPAGETYRDATSGKRVKRNPEWRCEDQDGER